MNKEKIITHANKIAKIVDKKIKANKALIIKFVQDPFLLITSLREISETVYICLNTIKKLCEERKIAFNFETLRADDQKQFQPAAKKINPTVTILNC
ncbi:hypothetical protein A3Q56_05521 [Intoshia linei]|uniref:Uncharacterized protein n=1 Tax=Intoshia linei TaxID=1819745 RepID=A0A177AY26_9BILA|nr:hypothetical protein A3Q56_05521 [Intoshia linei]